MYVYIMYAYIYIFASIFLSLLSRLISKYGLTKSVLQAPFLQTFFPFIELLLIESSNHRELILLRHTDPYSIEPALLSSALLWTSDCTVHR